MHPETVKVVHPDGYAVINESDFDASVHALYVEPLPDGDQLPVADNSDPLAGNVKAVSERVAAIADVNLLEALRARELSADKPRKGVVDAIDARLKVVAPQEQATV